MTDTEQTARRGVSKTQDKVLEAGHIFREVPTSDFGIDAHIEIKEGAVPTGRLIAVQIKAGTSYFTKSNETGFWHPVSEAHKKLWTNHSLPVIVVLCDVESEVCYYETVTEENCVRAGNKWKVLIPKAKVLSAASGPDLVSIACPIVAASDFTIHAEQDQSHAMARRISLDIVIHPGSKAVNKPWLGAIVRAALRQGQASQYHRDEISEKALRGRPVDVVWGFVYLRDIDRESASWVCRFLWISPRLDEAWRPITFEGEQDGTGLVIDWTSATVLPQLLDERRLSKAEYLRAVDRLLSKIPDVRTDLEQMLELWERSPASEDFPRLADEFESSWDGSFVAPLECQRLDHAVHELLATVGNAGLIWSERHSRDQMRTRSLMSNYRDQLDLLLDVQISFLRRDVR